MYTVPVRNQPESLVLVARKGRQLPRPGRADLREGVLRASGGSGLGIRAASLCSAMLWVEAPAEGAIIELVPPRSTAGLADAVATSQLRGQLRIGSSTHEYARGDVVEEAVEEEEEDGEGEADLDGGDDDDDEGSGLGDALPGDSLPRPEVAAAGVAGAGAAFATAMASAAPVGGATSVLKDFAVALASNLPM